MVHRFTAIGWLIITLVLYSVPVVCFAQTTYYVASNGNDTHDGRSADKPLLTLARVNQLTLRAGDAVLFRRGDTFRGTLSIRQSGTAGRPIRYDAYGSGKKPVLTGSLPVGNWTKLGDNRWQASCPDCEDRLTGLYLDGLAQPLGRYPNADAPGRGNLIVESHVGTSQLTTQETLTTDWTGAEMVLFPTYWIIDRAAIKQQQGNTLLLDNPSTYPLTDGWPCYIQNHPATLDQPGEWSYDATNKNIQLYTNQPNPNEQVITVTSADRVIDITRASYITIQNLHATQARVSNLYASNVSSLTLANDTFTEAGEDGVTIVGTGKTILIDHTTITNCNNNGFFIGAYQDFTFRYNTIRHIGMVPGRGKSGDGQFTGFQALTTRNALIENNVIDSIGYVALTAANNTLVRQNLISNFCATKSDGGGIYLFNGDQTPLHNIRIQSNIVYNGMDTYVGLPSNISGANGIFMDDCVEHVDIMDNTVFGCSGFGILMHAVNHVNLLGNTSFDNDMGQFVLYNYDAPCLPRDNIIQENILVAKTASQLVAGYISGNNDLAQFGLMDRNYYARPFKELSTVMAVYNHNIIDSLNLTQWQARYRKDLASKQSPFGYKGYKINKLYSANRLQHSFDTTTEGWDTWSPYGNGQLSWTAGTLLNGGSMQINVPKVSSQPDSYVLLYKRIPAVTKDRTYLIQFDAASPVNKKLVVYLRQNGAPYQDLTRRFEFMTGPSRQHYEFALTVSTSEATPLLSFQLRDESQPVWFDNVRVQEAVVEWVNPDDYIKLVHNPTVRDSVVVLDRPHRDVKNHYYTHQVTLKPYTSVVLLRDTLPPVDVRLAMRASQTVGKVTDTTTVVLTLRSESVGPLPVSSRVQWSCRLPPNLTLVDGRGLVYENNTLTGVVQQLRTDTTFTFRVKATVAGSYRIAAEVTETTFADPTSTPNSGTADGEDDTAESAWMIVEPDATTKPTGGLVTATQGPLKEAIVIYPNPASEEFTLVAEADIAVIRVVDLLGRERLTLGSVRRGTTIRFGKQLPSAYYLLYIDYKRGDKRVIKVLKQ